PRPARLSRRVPTHQKPVPPAALLDTIRRSVPAQA
ncbi:response regulator, partial [Desulfovibrio oxamicus]|nr:response regulator [Nitratidesulfovibrio oxamicus]